LSFDHTLALFGNINVACSDPLKVCNLAFVLNVADPMELPGLAGVLTVIRLADFVESP
jgi:hypothetical protein